MKNIIKILIVSLVVVFSSCTKLEEEPTGTLAPGTFFKTAEDVQAMINGAYGVMPSENYYGSDLTVLLQLASDMVDNGFEYSDYSEVSPFIITPTNSYVSSIWGVSYQVVAIANSAIGGVALIDAPEEEKNSLEAEARFLRAFAYYHLVRLFGDIPYIVEGDISSIEQSSVTEIYDKIIEDLEFGRQHLSIAPTGGIRSRPSQGTAASYLASVYLTLGNWQLAYDNAKWVIDNSGALEYALESDFQNLFRASEQANLQEYIFSMDFTGRLIGDGSNPLTLENDQLVGVFNGVQGGTDQYRGWSMLVPNLNVYSSWDPNDYRLKVSMTDSAEINDIPGIISPYADFTAWPAPHIAKWNRFAGEELFAFGGWRSDLDYPAFRYAEVLLIAAEAANELGNTGEATGYVNQLRARARAGGSINFAPVGYDSYAASATPADVVGGMSQSGFRTLVLEERRIELAFEFKRWYDIVRRDLGDQVFAPSGREPQSNFNKSKHYLLPIPQEDIDRNQKLVQNDGY